MSLGLFRNAKELWQTSFNMLILLIDNEIKYSRPQPPTGPVGQRGGLANMLFLEFWIFFRQKVVSSQARLYAYLGPQPILGNMHFGCPNALKLNAFSNDHDFALNSLICHIFDLPAESICSNLLLVWPCAFCVCLLTVL